MLHATREGLGMPHVIGSPGLSSAPRGVSPGSDMLGNGGWHSHRQCKGISPVVFQDELPRACETKTGSARTPIG